MAIHFECPHCKEGLRAPEEAVGETATCSRCYKKVIVPEKKEVLVPGKDGEPKKVSELESEAKPKHEGDKDKSINKKEVSQIDSEIDKKHRKEEPKDKSRTEKDIDDLRKRIDDENLTFTVSECEATKIPIEILCSEIEPPNWLENAKFDSTLGLAKLNLPSRFDWRDYTDLTPIKNQNSLMLRRLLRVKKVSLFPRRIMYRFSAIQYRNGCRDRLRASELSDSVVVKTEQA